MYWKRIRWRSRNKTPPTAAFFCEKDKKDKNLLLGRIYNKVNIVCQYLKLYKILMRSQIEDLRENLEDIKIWANSVYSTKRHKIFRFQVHLACLSCGYSFKREILLRPIICFRNLRVWDYVLSKANSEIISNWSVSAYFDIQLQVICYPRKTWPPSSAMLCPLT